MKIRYYLRGLGLGILVTAIFFMVSGKSSQTMSDEMIKARAKELGMSESVVLSELASQEEEMVPVVDEVATTAEETTEEVAVQETVAEVTSEEEADITEVTEETVNVESVSEEEAIEEPVDEESAVEEPVSETTEEVTVESTSQTASNSEPVVVTVNRGEGSDTVSRRLQEAGLVADAHEYDRYLMANGYDKRIGAGNHSIPAGATWEDIAKILCNMK